MKVGSVSVHGVIYEVVIVYGNEYEDFGEKDFGQFDPKNHRILIRNGSPLGTYEHEELHAVFDACGLALLLECDVKPRSKREELMVTMLTPAVRSVVRSPELQRWLASEGT